MTVRQTVKIYYTDFSIICVRDEYYMGHILLLLLRTQKLVWNIFIGIVRLVRF